MAYFKLQGMYITSVESEVRANDSEQWIDWEDLTQWASELSWETLTSPMNSTALIFKYFRMHSQGKRTLIEQRSHNGVSENFWPS